ncbi:gamma-glutamylcyclotransferase [Comamonas sp. Y6]|uniref:glutathione-specific gamma-glutamylcyclotransferase n=1 Tax=Comamonas resistens TaxID=3046670 RepID=A0ABY8SQ78_9BURK|nr:gamma-glutamylcyclotransferase [Comamonas resistens]MDL5035822.1 gamma-glutamylcyclotransferase [Comamonas resistens]WHS65232.1 gamma-glutamylcyclotransferase [Comamonas resistens]HBP0978978.1 gamma-glutamylcyclotransferase [Pseudomonas aeruginosa]
MNTNTKDSSVLDRKNLSSGAFLNSFKDAPGIEWWSEERIEASMQETLAQRPNGDPIWLFAYGSLICNPVFEFAENVMATLEGWHRSFCIRLVLARGSVDQPGRMLALEPGAFTDGVALRLREEDLEQELRMVWMREMVGGVYRPEWATITLEDGRAAQAIIFTANRESHLYESDASPNAIGPVIAVAHGSLGTNRDYVLQLDNALRMKGITDGYIRELADLLAQH